MRRRQLHRVGESADSDILDGRFARKPRKVKDLGKSGLDRVTSSTRPSTHLGQDDQTTLGDEESIQGLIRKELQIFFAAGADAKLFVKVLVNDGIVS